MTLTFARPRVTRHSYFDCDIITFTIETDVNSRLCRNGVGPISFSRAESTDFFSRCADVEKWIVFGDRSEALYMVWSANAFGSEVL